MTDLRDGIPRLDPAPQTHGASEFAAIADAIKAAMEPVGYHVHVNTNQRLIFVTEDGYVGGGESQVHVRVRSKPRG